MTQSITRSAKAPSISIDTLSNGMRVVTDTRPGVETAAVGVWVDAGARYESASMNGVAHMLEHMAFKGTQKRSALAIAEEIEAVGGHLNAYTSREHTAYYARVLRDDVPLSVDIIADILQHSVFDEEELSRERTVVIQEIGQSEDTPDDIIFDHLQATSFPDQPLGRPILGTVEGVSAMNRDKLSAFMGHHYTGDRLILCAAGAVDHDDVMALADRHFTDLPATNHRDPVGSTYHGGDFREDRDLEQVHFALALPGVPYSDDDFYAVQVVSTLLGGGMSSRLFQEVREKRGLCYSVFTFASSYSDCGTFGIYAGTGEQEVTELVPLICDALSQLSEDAQETEVARARAQMKAGTLMALESSTARAEQLARHMLVFGRPIPLPEIVEKIDAVDVATVKRVAARLARGGRPTVAAIGPLSQLASYDDIAARFA